MTPGRLARAVLGPAFQPVGWVYRRAFVDMAKIVEWMAGELPHAANVLDVGGGDGYAVNLLCEQRPDVTVTMTDIAPSVGGFIRAAYRSRVTLLPATDVSAVTGAFQAITLADVVHHVPPANRGRFFETLSAAAVRTGAGLILIKDIRPGGLRAKMASWTDHHITGDRHVSQIAEDEISIPGFKERARAMPDFPNYCVAFAR